MNTDITQPIKVPYTARTHNAGYVTAPIPVIALDRENDTQPWNVPVRKHTAIVLDVNDRVRASFKVGSRNTEGAAQRALAELPLHVRAGVTVRWTVQSAVRWVGQIQHGGRYLGTLLVTDNVTLREHDVLRLVVPATNV